MASPYIGEIRMFAGNFEPDGWMICDGRLLDILTYDGLFNLIGTTYGGDGESTYALPDLQSRVPIHMNPPAFDLAQTGGQEEVTLTVQQIPAHTHPPLVNSAGGTASDPTDHVLASSPTIDLYRESPPSTPLAPNAIGPAGGSQPHTNLQPYVCVNFIISLFGIFPSPT
jgi:microcystin-dependent protein